MSLNLAADDDRLLTSEESAQFLGLSRGGFYLKVEAGVVPQPIKLGTKTARWRLGDLRTYISRLATERDRAVPQYILLAAADFRNPDPTLPLVEAAIMIASTDGVRGVAPGLFGPEGIEPAPVRLGPGRTGWDALRTDPGKIAEDFNRTPAATAVLFEVRPKGIPRRFSWHRGKIEIVPERWPPRT